MQAGGMAKSLSLLSSHRLYKRVTVGGRQIRATGPEAAAAFEETCGLSSQNQ